MTRVVTRSRKIKTAADEGRRLVKCFRCDPDTGPWIDPKDSPFGLCPRHDAMRQQLEDAETATICQLLRAYSAETGDPAGERKAKVIEREREAARKGDFRHVKVDPRKLEMKIGFTPERFHAWVRSQRHSTGPQVG